jgi:hypothetical protein
VGAAVPDAEPFGWLLLVQPAGPGPYSRALAERGPGLPVAEGLRPPLETLGCAGLRPTSGRTALLRTASGSASIPGLLAAAT